MPCATPSPPTSSTAAPTSAPSRSCSATPIWRRPSTTRASARSGCARCTNRPIPELRRTRAGRMETEDQGELDQLWHDYKGSDDPKLRDALIVHYSPLVKYVAGRVAVGLPQSVEQADLVSYGIFGLIDAIAKFDLERGAKFRTCAIWRIKRAISDE